MAFPINAAPLKHHNPNVFLIDSSHLNKGKHSSKHIKLTHSRLLVREAMLKHKFHLEYFTSLIKLQVSPIKSSSNKHLPIDSSYFLTKVFLDLITKMVTKILETSFSDNPEPIKVKFFMHSKFSMATFILKQYTSHYGKSDFTYPIMNRSVEIFKDVLTMRTALFADKLKKNKRVKFQITN